MHPGEKLENGIQDIYILGEDEGLILKANETFKDTSEEDEKVITVMASWWRSGQFNACVVYLTIAMVKDVA